MSTTEDIIIDLRGSLAFDDYGKRPVRASVSRWIAHKWNAMKHVFFPSLVHILII